MQVLIFLGGLFVSVILADLILKKLCKLNKPFLAKLYQILSYITIFFLVVIAILCSTQLCNNLIIAILAFIMAVIFFTALNIEHYITT